MSTTISVSDLVADELYQRKGRAESYDDVLRRLLDEDRRTTDEPARRSEPQPDSEPEPTPEPDRDAVEDTGDASLADIVDTVADAELPGSGGKLEARREALHAVVEYLQDEGTATRSGFTTDIYPDHKGRYTTAYSWWKNALCDALGAVAERTDAIEKPDTAGEWRYVDGANGNE